MVHNYLPADKILMVTFNRGFSNFTLQSLSKQKLLLIFFEIAIYDCNIDIC